MEALILIYNLASLCVPVVLIWAIWQLVAAIVTSDADRRRIYLRKFGVLLGVVLVLPLLLMGLWRGVIRPQMASELRARMSSTRKVETRVNAGDTIQPFSIQTIDGESISIPAADQIIVVNFFATWCGPCHVELPHLQKIWEENEQDKRFKIVVVGQDESPEKIKNFRDKLGLTLPFATEQRGSIYSQFASEGIPRTLIFDPKGKVLYSALGFMEEEVEELREAVHDALLSLNTSSP